MMVLSPVRCFNFAKINDNLDVSTMQIEQPYPQLIFIRACVQVDIAWFVPSLGKFVSNLFLGR
jgi:hypothetical protein